MIDTLLALVGISLSLLWGLNPEWLPAVDFRYLAGLNGLLFLILGLRAIAQGQIRQELAAARKDIESLNSQTLRLNRELEAKDEELQSLKDQQATATASQASASQEAARLQQELADIRQKLAQAEDKLRTQSEVPQQTPQDKQAELVQFLSLLQKHGRFLDFVMGDITRYPDDRVGAAARVVHEGCAKTIKDYFDIRPIMNEDEGSNVEIADPQQSSRTIRLLGASGEDHPQKGRLVHRGWQTLKVDLPQRPRQTSDDLRVIAPAEIEVKS
jgi:multidrug efflux pump subunit AcrA (membrane-fusion protein)